MFIYLKWLLIFVWLPTLFLWLKNFDLLRRYTSTLSLCIIFALIFSVPWDLWAIKTKIWVFPQDTNLGIWFGGLPLEEYLFIIFVTLEIGSLTLVLKHRFKNLIIRSRK